GWEQSADSKEVWDRIDEIPDSEIWDIHLNLKKNCLNFIRDRLKHQRSNNGESRESLKELDRMLRPDVLTIGFARRFATYKRANLIFRNMDRIRRILNNPERPVQIIFAGKAHPADR